MFEYPNYLSRLCYHPSLASFMKINKSFENTLKKMGPIIDPSCTPERSILKRLSELLIFTTCIFHFKCEYKNVIAFMAIL